MTELLESGFSLREAVEFSKTIYPQWQIPIQKIERALVSGNSFATAMMEWVSIDTYYQLMLAERHGQILTTLRYFNRYLKMRGEQVKRLRHLLEYPLLLLVILSGVITMMMVLVLPQLNDFEEGRCHQLWNQVCQPLGSIIGGLIAMLIFRCWHYRQLSKINQVRTQCRLPVVGKLCRDYYGYYLCNNLALLLNEGLSLQSIIEMCGRFRKDSLLYQLSQKLKRISVNGEDVGQLIRHENFIPDELAILIQQGSKSNQLARQVNSLAGQLFKRLIMKCEQRLTLVQPILYLIIAGVIIGLYLQMLLPIYQSVQVIK